MKRITKKAYAKINLHLDITSKYPDGFHEVFTVMQSVSLCDDVEISVDSGAEIEIICSEKEIPTNEKNIAYRAAELFLSETGLIGKSKVSIALEKRVPSCAGLGGGSADAAAVLLGLNELFEYPMSSERLLEFAALIGADVPFCMLGGTAAAHGKGDKISTFLPTPECYIVIAKGSEGISTPWAYRELDRIYSDFSEESYAPHDSSPLCSAIESGDLKKMANSLYNVFESAILPICRDACHIKEVLKESGALGSLMSGSGTAVYGIFDDENAAHRALERIKRSDYVAFLARPVSKF